MSEEDTLKQLETNLFGVMRVTKAVLPTMRIQRSGRIVNIGSLAGHIAVPFQGMYATAKFALEGYTEQLRQETKSLRIHVSIVEPGFFKTNIGNSPLFASQEISDYKAEKSRAISTLRELGEKGADPIIVAKLILKILREEKPKLHYGVGKEKSGLLFKRLLPQSMLEGQVRRLFKIDASTRTNQ
jgi:short-subunit dehydrogenase